MPPPPLPPRDDPPPPPFPFWPFLVAAPMLACVGVGLLMTCLWSRVVPKPDSSRPAVPQAPAPPSKKKGRPQPPAPDRPDWARKARAGALEVTIHDVAWREVEVTTTALQVRSTVTCFAIELHLKNVSTNASLEYRTWGVPPVGPAPGHATLTDNFGNLCTPEPRSSKATITGEISHAGLFPGAERRDILLFDRPLRNVEHLTLTLPLERQGEKGALKFRIPARAIRWVAD
jgi:hypothetical protein